MKLLLFVILSFSLVPSGAWARAIRSRKSAHRSSARVARRAPARARTSVPSRAPARMARAPAPARGPASLRTGVVESDKSLKVMGQARSIDMTLVLKGDKDEIHFVKPRTSFQDKLGEDRF